MMASPELTYLGCNITQVASYLSFMRNLHLKVLRLVILYHINLECVTIEKEVIS